mgnify:FL=1
MGCCFFSRSLVVEGGGRHWGEGVSRGRVEEMGAHCCSKVTTWREQEDGSRGILSALACVLSGCGGGGRKSRRCGESLRVVSKQASSGGRVSFVVRRDSAEYVGGGAGKSTSQVVGLFGRIP